MKHKRKPCYDPLCEKHKGNDWKQQALDNETIIRELATAQQPLVDALKKYMIAMDALYHHNAATRAAVVQHFGTIHPPSVIAALAKVAK